MKYVDKLNELIEVDVPDDLSEADLLAHFRATMSGLIEARLEEMVTWLDETDVKMAEFFKAFELAALAEQASIKSKIKAQVAVWLAADHVLRGRFNTYWDQYSQKQLSADLITQLKESLAALEADIIKHATKANRYGREWITRADQVGLAITDAPTRDIIQWFSELTPETIKTDYARGQVEKPTPR